MSLSKQQFMHKIILVVIATSLFSCEKYLDEKSDKSLVVPATVDEFQSLLDEATYMNRSTPSLPESSADDYFLKKPEYDRFSEWQRNIYKWVPDDRYNYGNDWSNSYRAIFIANICIEGLNKIPLNDRNFQQWNNVMGSALYFRSFHLLNLAWTYGKAYDARSARTDLGVVLRESSDFNIPSVRSSIEATYELLLNDAKASIDFLPGAAEHVMRPSKIAAYALLARAYLSMNQFDSALKYSDLCLSQKSNLLDYNTVPINAAVPFAPFNEEIIFYAQMNLNVPLYSPARAFIDSNLYGSYSDNDLRKKAFYTEVAGGDYRFKGSYAASTANMFTGLATDEILLIRAECTIRLNDLAKGLNDLNTLLKKRWLSGTFEDIEVTDYDEALKIVLAERRKQLVMRGIRWSDIKRLNLLGAGIVLKREVDGEIFLLPPNDRRYALPIPRDLVENYGILQN